jgi:hypothetical protein
MRDLGHAPTRLVLRAKRCIPNWAFVGEQRLTRAENGKAQCSREPGIIEPRGNPNILVAPSERPASPLPHVHARAREIIEEFLSDRRSDRMDQGPLASEQFGCSASHARTIEGSMPARTSPNVSASTWNSQPVRSKAHIAMHSHPM